ncbi:MAG: DNA repair protein RecN [Lachnospiraceae bacterium]|nr:DNA repair protein RecN [Lachnospiraceae bacterium]
MLQSLHVKNLALIEEEEIFFGDALNILTGETGAGKSIVLGSVNLALGAKTGSDIIRSGSEYALVELVFSLNGEEEQKVRELDLDAEDGTLIISRKISNGKSVCRVNGETVPASTVKKLASFLIDIYGQNENQSLLKSATYERMLDKYAGKEVSSLQCELKSVRDKYNEICTELDREDNDSSVTDRERELLEYEVLQIRNAELKPGEDEELENRFRFLKNARKIAQAMSETHQLTGYDSPGAIGNLIGNAVSKLNSVAGFDDRIASLSRELSDAEEIISGFNRSISSYEDSLTFDEEEFDQIEQRLDLINSLKMRFGDSLEKISDALAKKEERLDKLSNFDKYLADLKNEKDRLHRSMIDICKKISDLRSGASRGLTEELQSAMEGLNFLNTDLRIDVNPNPDSITDTGYDNIEFLVSLNVGEELKPMQNVASGGELSRIMLAIKSVFADDNDVSTLIFDEIDSGISGKTAFKVATKMNELSKGHQLICITHLPQIASMADTHFLIEKSVSEGRTVTGINKLDDEGSVRELARMLGGEDITEAALNNAREMKKGKYDK